MLTLDLFASLCLFAVVSSITPGPNNLMLLTSGVNFGVRRTLPHSLGVSVGFFVMLLVVGAGIGSLLLMYPSVYGVLKIVSSLYLLYLAYKLARSRPLTAPGEGVARRQPLTFMQAALFQWVNPKAWIMALSGISLYTTPAHPLLSVLLVSAIFGVLNWPCTTSWAVFGSVLRRFLADERANRVFNLLMAALMACSVLMILKS